MFWLSFSLWNVFLCQLKDSWTFSFETLDMMASLLLVNTVLWTMFHTHRGSCLPKGEDNTNDEITDVTMGFEPKLLLYLYHLSSLTMQDLSWRECVHAGMSKQSLWRGSLSAWGRKLRRQSKTSMLLRYDKSIPSAFLIRGVVLKSLALTTMLDVTVACSGKCMVQGHI